MFRSPCGMTRVGFLFATTLLAVPLRPSLSQDSTRGYAPLEVAAAAHHPRLLLWTSDGEVAVDVAKTPMLRNRIDVEFASAPLRDALRDIAAKSGIALMYADTLVPPVSVRLRAEGITVAAALTDVLDGTGIDVLFTRTGEASLVRRAPQPRTGVVTGTVKDSLGSAVPGAAVLVEGTRLSAVTDAEGAYRIAGLSPGSHTISVRRIGYQPATKTIVVSEGTNEPLAFVLPVSAESLKAVVVTGTAGAVQRLTQAAVVASVDAKELQTVAPAVDFEQMVQANVAGADVGATGSQTGAAMHMVIRGPASVFLNNEPLVFIDGVRMNSTPRALLNLGGQQANPLDNLNPDDIASIEIVKGPAASTLYGADASSGVINILTKRGAVGGGMTQALVLEGSRNDVGYTPYTNYATCSAGAVLATSSSYLCHGLTAGTVITDNPLLRTGAFRVGLGGKADYNLHGGGKDFSYFASGNIMNEQGVEVPNGLHAITARGNFSWIATPKLSLNLGMNVSNNDDLLSNGDQGAALSIGGFGGNPLTVFRTASGALDGGWYQSPGTELDRYNSLRNQYLTLRSTPSAEITYNWTPWFKNRLRLGADISQTVANAFSPIDTALSGTAALGSANDIHQAINVYTLDYSGTIHHDFGQTQNISSDLTLGSQYIETDNSQINALGQQFITNQANLAGLAASNAIAGEAVTYQKSFGLLAQEDLGFAKKWFTQLGVRIDKNSSFGANAPSFVLPKIGVVYVMSEEPFWQRVSRVISTMRLRAAFGTTGRSPPPGSALATYSSAAYASGTSVNAGVALNNPGNPDLKAEVGTELEAGFDAAFWEDRMNLEVTYFDKTSKNLLIQKPLPPSDGYSANPYVNVGEVNNQGFEFILHGSMVDTRRVAWDIQLSANTLRNRVVSLGDIAAFTNQTRVAPGYPLGSLFTNGFISTNVATNTNVVTDTAVYQGNSNPSLVTNFGNTVTLFGRLKLYGLLVSKRGFTINNFTQYYRDQVLGNGAYTHLPYGQGGYSPEQLTQVLGKSYTESDGPVGPAGTLVTLGDFSPIYMQSGNFVRLQDVSATWTLPENTMRRLGFSNASITVGGSNLKTWTKYDGLDPDASSFTPEFTGGGAETLVRLDVFAAPPPRRVFTRFNFTF